MNISVKDTLVICLLLLVPLQKARAQTDASKPRIPTGIYAVVKVEETAAMVKLGPIAIGGFDSAFIAFYNALLDNPAVSGLALQVEWATLNPDGPNAAAPTGGITWTMRSRPSTLGIPTIRTRRSKRQSSSSWRRGSTPLSG